MKVHNSVLLGISIVSSLVLFLLITDLLFFIGVIDDFSSIENIGLREGYPMGKNLNESFEFPQFPEIPHTRIETNSLGIRERENISNRKENFRILSMGDSITFGLGVNNQETYSEQLEKKVGGDYEVINVGVPGYNLEDQLLILKNIGLALSPDLILLYLNSNDNHVGIVQDKPFTDTRSNIIRWMNYKYLEYKLQDYYENYNSSDKLKSVYNPLNEIILLSKSHSIPVLVIVQSSGDPSNNELNETDTRQIEQYLKEQGIHTIYLKDTSFFKTNLSDIFLYVKDGVILEGHYSPNGNERLADLIYETLQEKNLLSEE